MAVAHGIGLTRDRDLNRPAEACPLELPMVSSHTVQWHIISSEHTV